MNFQLSPNLVLTLFLCVVIRFIRKPLSPPRTPVSHSSVMSPLTTVGRSDGGAPIPKHGQFILRPSHPSQASEVYYQEPHSTYDTAHYQPACEFVFTRSWMCRNTSLLCDRRKVFIASVFLLSLLLSSRFLLPIKSSSPSQTLYGSVPAILQRPRILSATFHWSSIFLPK